MPTDFFNGLYSNVWSITLIVVFFGGSIFVHELGHFLVARWRGVKVTRFSIGFGPKIFSWKGKDGVEYRLSWLPLGGYVALPQLADMRAIEGDSEGEFDKLPPIDYLSKMLVFVAGAAFNVIFAFLLASVITLIGLPEPDDIKTTQIGIVYPSVQLADGSQTDSPASLAGLMPGDTILSVDGRPVEDWNDLREALTMGAGRTSTGNPEATLGVDREGQELRIIVEPVLAGPEGVRQIGISPIEDYDLIVGQVPTDSIGAAVGFQVGDTIASLDGQPVRGLSRYQEYLLANKTRPVDAEVLRGAETIHLSIPARPSAVDTPGLNLLFTTGYHLVHPGPFEQVWGQVVRTFRTLASLLNPRSDIGLSKVSGPVGIVHIFYDAAAAGIRIVIWFTILINISLAVFNLLPIPVLDGGHMLFATIGRLRGRPLPGSFIMTTQSVFMMLLFSMILYVSFFDVRRIAREIQENNPEAAESAPATQSPSNPPDAPQPAK